MKNVIICCPSSNITSAMIEMSVKELLAKNNIPANVRRCMYIEVEGLLKSMKVDLIIPNGTYEAEGIPVISGLPYLTGIGVGELEEQIIEALK